MTKYTAEQAAFAMRQTYSETPVSEICRKMGTAKQIFIDGRMATWRWDENPKGESGYIMGEYISAGRGDSPFFDLFDRYGVDLVLVRSRTVPSRKDEIYYRLSKKIHTMVTGKELKNVDLLAELESSAAWEMIHQDEVALIFRRVSQ